jgi:hypothetical protein
LQLATNRFHETWHVVTDIAGARYLARICWAMAYQRVPGTVFVFDSPHLVPNPFDADPSSPLVIHNADLGSLSRREADDLRDALPFRGASEGTVTLQTHGLDAAATDRDAFFEDDPLQWNKHQQRSWIERSNGLVILAAPPAVLKGWGVALSRLGDWFYAGGEEIELDYPNYDGAVQVLEDVGGRLASAQAKREALFPGRSHGELTDEERALVWSSPPPG